MALEIVDWKELKLATTAQVYVSMSQSSTTKSSAVDSSVTISASSAQMSHLLIPSLLPASSSSLPLSYSPVSPPSTPSTPKSPNEESTTDFLPSQLSLLHNKSNSTDSLLNEFDLDLQVEDVDNHIMRFAEDKIVKLALERGVNLQIYSKQIEEECQQAEQKCVDEYFMQSNELFALHSQIVHCDSILNSMEKYLFSFQKDLSMISTQIESLQTQSKSMQIQVRNRKTAEEKIAIFITKLLLPPSIALQIIEGEMRESYAQALNQLQEKISMLEQIQTSSSLFGMNSTSLSSSISAQQPYQIVAELSPLYSKLTLRAISKIRTYLYERIYALLKPKTNIQIKQKLLLKHKYFYTFLFTHSKEYANEIRNYYASVVSTIYSTKFTKYLTEMKKLIRIANVLTSAEKLGENESYVRSMSGFWSLKKEEQDITMLFLLSTRHLILTEKADDLIIPHVAEQKSKKFYFEEVYKSVQFLLMDIVTSEVDFLQAMFEPSISPYSTNGNSSSWKDMDGSMDTSSAAIAFSTLVTPPRIDNTNPLHPSQASPLSSLFLSLFSNTFNSFFQFVSDFILQTSDIYCVLLCIRLLCQANLIMQSRANTFCNELFDKMNAMLWPRFKILFERHISSITSLSAIDWKTPNQTAATTIPQKFLPVTLRFAHFSSTIVLLNQYYSDDILIFNNKRFRIEMSKLYYRTAAQLQTPKAQIIFLIHQYSVILSILSHSLHPNADKDDNFIFWSELHSMQISLYVEEELSVKFKQLITFVKNTELQVQQMQKDKQTPHGAEASTFIFQQDDFSEIMQHFNRFWRDGMEAIYQSVCNNFALKKEETDKKWAIFGLTSSSMHAREWIEILKQIYVQLVLYYQRFQDLGKKYGRLSTALQKEIVPVSQIMTEIKKYSSLN